MTCGNCPPGAPCDCDDSYDRPNVDELLQDEPTPAAGAPVPVAVVGPVRVEELPTTNGGAGNIVLRTGARAIRIANADPRRKRLIVWCFGMGVGAEVLCLGMTRQESDSFTGPMVFAAGAAPVRYELAGTNEWWARGGDIQATTGTVEAFIPSTDDIVMSYIDEKWAR